MKYVVFSAGIIVFFAGTLAKEVKPSVVPDQKRYIEYLAGTELIINDQKGDKKVHAEKYRKLCALTGVNAAMAEKFIKGYSQRPDEWRKIQSAVLELLQTIK
jgi:hypothetical protein